MTGRHSSAPVAPAPKPLRSIAVHQVGYPAGSFPPSDDDNPYYAARQGRGGAPNYYR